MTIIGGFGIAAYMIQLSSITWSEHPVITTLDSITAPIDDVQFPTITVCSADQPNTWAFLENVLNNVAVECDNDKDCMNTNQLRQDFQYIFESIGDVASSAEEGLCERERAPSPHWTIVRPATKERVPRGKSEKVWF